jgi:hypothetical protein
VFISTLATVGDGSRLGATPDGTPNGRQHLHAVADHHPVDLAAPHSYEQCGIRVARGLKTEPAIAAALDWAGDPYRAVIRLANATDGELVTLLQRAHLDCMRYEGACPTRAG